MHKSFRDSKFRRITESLLWPDEPIELREKFDELFVNIFGFRSSLKGNYKNSADIEKAKRN